MFDNIKKIDPGIAECIEKEYERQQNNIELIASENITSKVVLEACGSILTNKYAEGTPYHRYYNGNKYIDEIEFCCQERAKLLFHMDHANVQPHSGAQANMAVFMYTLNPNDTVLSMDLSNGGHLSHGSHVNFSGKYFHIVTYGVNPNGYIDYDDVLNKAIEYQPKLIVCGASNYSKIIDFKRFKEIADEVDALLLCDIAHIAGLVAGGTHPSPAPYADFITTTTHKSLRGPRGGIILCKKEHAKGIDKAVFPGIQGGPLEHIIAAKAICLKEAMQPEFKKYAKQVVENAKILCYHLIREGIDIVGGMTENHLMTIDLSKYNVTGQEIADKLEEINITVNKNTIPNDPKGPIKTSGIRIGTPAVTTRGFKEKEMITIANIIANVIKGYDTKELKKQVQRMCKKHPIYR